MNATKKKNESNNTVKYIYTFGWALQMAIYNYEAELVFLQNLT